MYLRAGAADVKGEGDLDLKSDAEFFGGIGLHGRFYNNEKYHLSLGPVANFAYYSDWKDSGHGHHRRPRRSRHRPRLYRAP